MKNRAKSSSIVRLVALFAIIFVMQTFPMMQPRSQQAISKRAIKGYTIPKKQLEQQVSVEQEKALKEAFMSDEQLKERRKQEAIQKAFKRIMAEKGEKLVFPERSELIKPFEQMNVKQKRELEEAFMTNEELQTKRNLERVQQREELLQQQRARQHPNEYFIYVTDHPNEGIFVDKEVVENTSKTLKAMIEDFGGNISAVPVPSSFYTMKLAVDILRQYNALGKEFLLRKHNKILSLEELKNVNVLFNKYLNEISSEELFNEIDTSNLSLLELIDIANLFNYLEVPKNILDLVLYRIKIDLKHDNEKIIELKMLHPDLQKIAMVAPTIDYLKTFIIKKYAEKRKKILIDYAYNVTSLAVSPDGTKMLSTGEKPAQNHGNELILWDISDPNNIKQLLKRYGQTGDYSKVAFSPSGQQFVSAGLHLFLWNINNLMLPKPLIGHQGTIKSVAFNADGTQMVSGSSGNQNTLIVWDITNPNNIIQQILVDQFHEDINSVAFNKDGTQIVSGGRTKLILWDMNNWGINNPDAIITPHLVDRGNLIAKTFFSPDNTKVGVTNANSQHSVLWDIADFSKWLSLPGSCDGSQSFNPDGKSIIVYAKGLLRWYDISHFKHIEIGKPLADHSDWIKTAVFNSDGKRIASGGDNSSKFFNRNNLILWDVSDRDNIAFQSLKGHPNDVTQALFSSGDKNLISASVGRYNNLILWPLLTDQEEALLKALHTDRYTADQVRLIYTWCLQASKDKIISLKSDSEEYNIFWTLPEEMQNLLKDLLFSKGWLSGWW